MKHWTGVERATDPTMPGTHYAEGARFYTEGELRRRNGLAKLGQPSGSGCVAIAHFWTPASGPRALFLLVQGTIVELAAT